jgi:hypothetical protein
MYSRKLSEQLKERPRRPLEEERVTVGEEWHREEAHLSQTMVAPRTIGLMRKVLLWSLVAAVLFFVVALGFFAYYFTFGGGASSASARNIDISISGPLRSREGTPRSCR